MGAIYRLAVEQQQLTTLNQEWAQFSIVEHFLNSLTRMVLVHGNHTCMVLFFGQRELLIGPSVTVSLPGSGLV